MLKIKNNHTQYALKYTVYIKIALIWKKIIIRKYINKKYVNKNI